MSVLLKTSLGDLQIKLFPDVAPKNVANFLKLCHVKYYSGLTFFYLDKNFIVQSGDPKNDGTGGNTFAGLLSGQNVFIPDEISKKVRHDKKGIVGMANQGADMNTSQFYITFAPIPSLDAKKTIIGEIEKVEHWIDVFNDVLTIENRPVKDILIIDTIVEDDPISSKEDLEIYKKLELKSHAKKSIGINKRPLKDSDSNSKDFVESIKEGSNGEGSKELPTKDSAAHDSAITLEMLGERKSAQEKAPENILFVCKLNPLTESADLKTIFSRFGAIKSCEIVKDRVTGRSHCYAFIEFVDCEACDEAYLKMNNVIIDNARIKVDFSQSLYERKATSRPRPRTYHERNRNDRSSTLRSRSKSPKRL